jgi:hypothetical protein
MIIKSYIYEPALRVKPENVVLREICMDEVAGVVELHHHLLDLLVGLRHLGFAHPEHGLLELGCRPPLAPHEGHDQDVLLQNHHLGHSVESMRRKLENLKLQEANINMS